MVIRELGYREKGELEYCKSDMNVSKRTALRISNSAMTGLTQSWLSMPSTKSFYTTE